MALKRRNLPPRPRLDRGNTPPKPMKVIALSPQQKGLRINCDGLHVIITRLPSGGTCARVVQTKDEKHNFRASIVGDIAEGVSIVCTHGGNVYGELICPDCGART